MRKSHHILSLAGALDTAARRKRNPKILVCGPSNQSVDALVKKMYEMFPEVKMVRVYAKSLDTEFASKADEVNTKLRESEAVDLGDDVAAGLDELEEAEEYLRHTWAEKILSRQVNLLAKRYTDAGDREAREWQRMVDRLKTEGNNLYRHGLDKFKVFTTVDGFQGDEREIMLVSFVRATYDSAGNASQPTGLKTFITNPNRACVATTRARELQILVGDTVFLRGAYFTPGNH